uniref:Cytochrome c oxidase polypeptide II n=1 Tax=Parastrongyloides trichosuri TaxID=131310 RepID=A0A0N4ZTE4_PARTI
MVHTPIDSFRRIYPNRDEPLMSDMYMDEIFSHVSHGNPPYFHHLRTYPALSELSTNFSMQYNSLHYSRINSWDIIIFFTILISIFIIFLLAALTFIYKRYRKYRNIVPLINENQPIERIKKENIFQTEKGHTKFIDNNHGFFV